MRVSLNYPREYNTRGHSGHWFAHSLKSQNLRHPFTVFRSFQYVRKSTILIDLMAVETVINYFDLSNDRVFYPGTAGYQRRKFDVKPTIINDVRGREDDFTLDKNGFQILQGIWSEADVEDIPEHIKDVVFPETIAAVKQACVYYHLKLDTSWNAELWG